MAKFVANKSTGLLKSVKERALSKKAEDEQKKQLVPYFHTDCISNILVRLPLESLQSSRFVCKPWYNIINSSSFVGDHLRCSESVLIFLNSAPLKNQDTSPPPNFSVEASIPRLHHTSIFGEPSITRRQKLFIQFLEFKEGKAKVGGYNVSCRGNIRGSCNGLILLDNVVKEGGLVIMNPVTRKLMPLPLGTICSQRESYGFFMNNATGEYKIVHLFQDELRYINCEILNVGERFWKEVNGPPNGLFGLFGYEPVAAIGSLHWIPHNDYLVSMDVDSEKFHTVPLPKTCGSYDKIIEMGGFLSFVTHEDLNIDIWILKSLSRDVWTKQYIITRGSVIDMVPMFSMRISGELIFKRYEDGSFHAFDFKSHEMQRVEMDKECLHSHFRYMPHVNSLVSWMKIQDACY